MELYLPFPRSTITQPFGANANTLYAGQGLKGHTAMDWGTACGTPLPNCAEGYCYSHINKDNSDLSRYRAVFFIVESDKGVFEVSYGHLDQIHAEPGRYYKVGEIIGTTGNTGDVYSWGVKVTQYRPGCPGGHLHGPQVRPVKKVTKKARGKRYLTTSNGVFKKDGFYYEILNYNNGYNGCVDPEPYIVNTLAAEATAPPVRLEIGSKGAIIRKLQETLKRLGFFPQEQEITDFYGPITDRAYREFMASTGLKITL